LLRRTGVALEHRFAARLDISPKPALNTFTDFFDTAKVYYAIRRQCPQWIDIRRSANGSFGSKPAMRKKQRHPAWPDT
jgi:hypothetical protein